MAQTPASLNPGVSRLPKTVTWKRTGRNSNRRHFWTFCIASERSTVTRHIVAGRSTRRTKQSPTCNDSFRRCWWIANLVHLAIITTRTDSSSPLAAINNNNCHANEFSPQTMHISLRLRPYIYTHQVLSLQTSLSLIAAPLAASNITGLVAIAFFFASVSGNK